jgi:multiple sugar transport system ATP-binding protein
MIFDNLALYPDKNGFQNMASALLHRKVPLEVVRARVFAVAEKLGLTRVLDRLPRTMSGGERQRLALGRALVRRPRFFLLDEPLSSLDAPLRLMIRAELKRLQREEGHSFLMATPDFAEALAVADSIVTLRGGRVVQTGSPADIYENPVDAESALFVGSPRINLLRGECRDGRLRLLDLDLPCPARWLPALAASGPRELTVGLRPEKVGLLAPDQDSGGDPLAGRLPVVDVESLGRTLAVTVRREGETMTILADGTTRPHVAIGRQIAWRLVDPESLLAFDPATGRSLLAPPRP